METYKLEQDNVSAEVVVDRGAIATRLTVGGKELLYLDRETLEDRSRNVRGGIPILFPFAGRLEGDRFAPGNSTIGQHGFARNKAWNAFDRRPGELACELESDSETLMVFPWRFRLVSRFLLVSSGMHVELLIQNLEDRPMPVAPGWHPYFPCPPDRKDEVIGSAAGMDAGVLHNDGEPNLGLPTPQDGRVGFMLPGTGDVLLSYSPEMRHLQLWSQQGKPFVCVEPFTGAPGLINEEDTPMVPGRSARMFWMRIQLGARRRAE